MLSKHKILSAVNTESPLVWASRAHDVCISKGFDCLVWLELQVVLIKTQCDHYYDLIVSDKLVSRIEILPNNLVLVINNL